MCYNHACDEIAACLILPNKVRLVCRCKGSLDRAEMVSLKAQPIRILVVDNDPKTTLTLAASLEKMGDEFAVDAARSFTEALPKVMRTPYALLITEHKLPGLNGLDLARAVRGVSPHTQIVLMSAFGTQALSETAQLLGFAGYLEKPFTIAQVRELVQRAVYDSPTVRRVLLIENNDGLRILYGQALQNAGYIVSEASSLQEARDLLIDNWFDIILCSLDVGGPKSMRFLREQTAKLSQIGTHVIAISAEGGYRSICEELGVDFYLEMPIAVGPLVTLVDRLAAKH
jgi:DNA-binding NtrC family response regulator